MEVDKKIYYPIFASRLLNGGNQDEIEHKEVIQQLLLLDSQKRLSLLSGNMANALAMLEERFHLPEQFVEYVTVLVRDMFFGKFSEQEILRALRGELSKIPNISLDPIIQHIQLNVFKAQLDTEEPDEEAAIIPSDSVNIKQYTLLDALGKFPNLGNQLITTENIKLKSQVAPVRPTLSNWLKNYRDELGIGMHDAVARARFLFESKNTTSLPSTERERIHAIVRSIEDNEAMNIDLQKQVIVFMDEEKNESVSESKTSTPESNTPSPDIFERFQNIQPREELKNVGTQTFMAAKPIEEKKPAPEEAVLGRIKNMLVFPPKANAPAPESDFIQPEEGETPLLPNEPLGTLRFSAKHVLPAERQEGTRPVPQSPPMDPRIAHFGPQEVNIPGTQKAYTYAPKNAPGGPAMPSPPQTKPEPVVAPSPQISNPNVFRIKPNRD